MLYVGYMYTCHVICTTPPTLDFIVILSANLFVDHSPLVQRIYG